MQTELRITSHIVHGDDEIALLVLDGYIDSTTAVQLRKEIEHFGRKIVRFVINFAGVEYVSSAGWGVILARIREFREQKGDIVFVKMSDEVHSIFELLELSQIIKYFPTVEEALKHFGVTAPVSLAELAVPGTGEDRPREERTLKIDEAIRVIVRENPLLSASQIRHSLTSPAYGFKKLSTLKVYVLLRRLGLHTREQKLYYAWRYLVKKLRT